MVKAKKHLGQHFLKDQTFAKRIADALVYSENDYVLEIGPGTGVLTRYFEHHASKFVACEVDTESIDYLKEYYPALDNSILNQDFLKFDLSTFTQEPIHIIGNFPYNISSQILFKVFDNLEQIPQVVGMFQKEVAKRVAADPGNKTYGILSVLLRTFYTIDYLFTVPPEAFNPPPKVDSGVIRLTRNLRTDLPIEKVFFAQVVKTAFNQRRKTLRNALKSLLTDTNKNQVPYLDKRAEQLNENQFIEIAVALKQS